MILWSVHYMPWIEFQALKEGSAFSLHESRDEAIRRGEDGFGFFQYAISALVTNDVLPGRSQLWEKYMQKKAAVEAGENVEDVGYGGKVVKADHRMARQAGIGTPEEFCTHMKAFSEAGVDQVIFLQQGGNNKHEHICESLETFAREVHDDFAEDREEREAKKAEELAPYIEAALARRKTRPPMLDADIPVVPAVYPKTPAQAQK